MFPDDLSVFTREFFKTLIEGSIEEGIINIEKTFNNYRDCIPIIESIIDYLSEQAIKIGNKESSVFSSRFIIKAMKSCWDARIAAKPGYWNNLLVLKALFFVLMEDSKKFRSNDFQDSVSVIYKETTNFDQLIKDLQ